MKDFTPPGHQRINAGEKLKEIAGIVASLTGLEASSIAAMTIVIGDFDGRVAVVSGSAPPMVIVSLLAQGIDHVAGNEIKAMGQLS